MHRSRHSIRFRLFGCWKLSATRVWVIFGRARRAKYHPWCDPICPLYSLPLRGGVRNDLFRCRQQISPRGPRALPSSLMSSSGAEGSVRCGLTCLSHPQPLFGRWPFPHLGSDHTGTRTCVSSNYPQVQISENRELKVDEIQRPIVGGSWRSKTEFGQLEIKIVPFWTGIRRVCRTQVPTRVEKRRIFFSPSINVMGREVESF